MSVRTTKRNPFPALWTVVLGLVVFAAMTVFVHNAYTAPYPGMNDFLTTWEGARTFFYEGHSPYLEQATLNIQKRIYGRPALPGEWPNYFAYPFHTAFVMYPFVHVDYAWASAGWFALMQIGVVAATLMLLQILCWRPPPLMLGAVLIWMLFFYPTARGSILGQVSHAVFFLQILALWWMARSRDVPAGIALAISTFKPHLGVFLIPFLMLWALRNRRFRLVIAFTAGFGAIMAACFVVHPAWLEGWFYQLRIYPDYTPITSPVTMLARLFGLGEGVESVVNLLLIGGLLYTWYEALWRNEPRLFWWALAMTVVLTHFILVRTASPHFVYFALIYFVWARELARLKRPLPMYGLLALLLILPWWQFLITIEGEMESSWVFVPLPLVTLFGLVATRNLWRRSAPPPPGLAG